MTDGDARTALDELLAPLDPTEFFDAWWERAPLHVSRPRDRGRFAPLVSLGQIESLLGTREPRYPDVQLSRSDAPVTPADYTDAAGRIVVARLLEHHAEGATIVLSGAHRELAPLAALRRRAERALRLRCQTNLYLSPPGRQGFNAHHDTHDVFVLQIEGRKSFDFHAGGLELPLAHDTFDPARHPRGEITESVTLEPGDTLYIPRGMTHDARACDGQPSLHVTLGVFAVTAHEVLEELLRVAAENDVALRRSVPRSLWSRDDAAIGGSPSGAREALAQALTGAFSEERLEEALSRLHDALALGGVPDCTGRLGESGVRGALGADTLVAVRPEMILGVERRAERLRLRLFGQVIEFDDPLGRALEWLLDAGRARTGDLPGLDDGQRLALCRRLRQANVIESLSPGK